MVPLNKIKAQKVCGLATGSHLYLVPLFMQQLVDRNILLLHNLFHITSTYTKVLSAVIMLPPPCFHHQICGMRLVNVVGIQCALVKHEKPQRGAAEAAFRWERNAKIPVHLDQVHVEEPQVVHIFELRHYNLPLQLAS